MDKSCRYCESCGIGLCDFDVECAEYKPFDIMQSIHPKWTKKIFSGDKTIELRKTKPSYITFPIKVYIYETIKGGGAGAVVGEYTCTGISQMLYIMTASRRSAVSVYEILEYADGGIVYEWEIANVIKYPKPRLLSDFGLDKPPQSWGYVKGEIAV